jgi:endonuclease YncB( thermonuclease family)
VTSSELVLGAVAVLVAALVAWRLSWTVLSWVRLVRSWLPGSSSGLEFVERVIDGDTLVLRGRGSCRIRGIDAPDAGWRKRRAARVLRRFVGRRRVRVVFHGPDRYGRQVVDVWRGARSVEAHMRGRGAAVAWDGRGRSPLKSWRCWQHWVIGR